MSKQLVIDHVWPKTITVDKRIVKILSASTYDNFPNALKEIITNSYDADASVVDVKIDIKNEIITITDDGSGMSEADFTLYLRIAGSKREKKPKTPSGRFVIGQFGVGFLSVFPFFKNYSIETTKSNSDEILYADIPCDMYFGNNFLDISQINVQGGIRHDRSKTSQHYTKIKLSGFTNLSRAFFFPNRKVKPNRNSILKQSSMDILTWRLSEDLPLKYIDNRLNKPFDKFTPNLPFKVKFNNEELLRKAYGKEILEIHQGDYEKIGKIKYRYFIVTDKKTIDNPSEARYFKIRNLNAGVGDRTSFGLGTEFGGARSRIHQLSGEIHIVEGLNDLITTSRDKFNYDPDYEELKDLFIKKLSSHSSQLEDEKEMKDFVEDAKDENKIKNIKLLGKKNIEKKIKKLEKGYEKKKYAASQIVEEPSDEPTTKNYIEEEDIELFEKKMKIDGKSYKVVLESWNYRDDFFPACKIDDNILYINEKYPLFKSVKYTDIFIKLHVMLLKNLRAGILNRNVFKELSAEIIETYKDYIKK